MRAVLGGVDHSFAPRSRFPGDRAPGLGAVKIVRPRYVRALHLDSAIVAGVGAPLSEA